MVKAKVPSSADTAKKWAEETPRRATYYGTNTPGAASEWESNTIASAENYKNAIQAADIAKRFSGGIKRVGASKFARKVTSVGISRYGPGVTAAQSDMQSGIDPYLSEIASVELPSRKPRGDPSNYDRVTKIGAALNKKRLAILAAG